ncbi:class E sortase [Asanoa sp. NPDC049518]|uniref:class E sortase n=1 Tax=unclassified Asanoa TaxID=2685164 RepID=UPI003430E5F9
MRAGRWTGSALSGAGLVLLAVAVVPAPPSPVGNGITSRATPGTPIARLGIPRLRERWTVVEGVDAASIADAPGHYPQTAPPGQVGNFAVAGHRVPGLFWDLDRLAPGDEVIVEYGSRTFTYAVTGSRVVAPTAVEVLAPVPSAPTTAATKAVLTLTTCEPKWSDARRLVVHAALLSSGEVATT